ncbi:MAG: YceD family protein [Oscillospiraceae bacterium]
MLLNLKQLSRENIDYKSLKYDVAATKDAMTYTLNEDFSINVDGFCEKKNSIIYIKYDAKFFVNFSCDRCLKICTKDFSLSYKHEVSESKIFESEDYNVFLQNHFLDLDKLIISDIIVDFPLKLLCDNNCKGFCHICGKDKNIDTCNCEDNLGDPRMEILKKLLK